MNKSNSFNICPRCGNSNALSAKYCACCGSQLKVPDEVIVCPTCHTRNSPMANFCRNCGNQLKLGEQTKICPRCGKEVPIDTNVCTCGYSFATITTVAPNDAVPVHQPAQNAPVVVTEEQLKEDTKKAKKQRKERAPKEPKAKKVTSNKGGRGLAVVALVFLLLFAYLAIAPAQFRPDFLTKLDGGFVSTTAEGATTQVYLYDYALQLISGVKDAIANPQGNIVVAIYNAVGILGLIVVAFAMSVVCHLLVCLVRIFSGKRSKGANALYLLLAIITTLLTVVIYFANHPIGTDVLAGALDTFKLADGVATGWVMFVIPVYYWFFYIYSAIAKAKVLKEQAA